MKFSMPRLKTILILAMTILSLMATAQGARPQDKPEMPKIIRKPGGMLQTSSIKRVEPAYPPLAKAARISGGVVVEVTVDEAGKVIAARAVSGHPLLKDAAVAAARGWVFTPTQLSGTPVKVIGTITFNFTLPTEKDIEKLKQDIAQNPNAPDLYYNLGRAYEDNGELEKAVEPYKQAIALKPDYENALAALSSVYLRLDRYEEALAVSNQALLLNLSSETKATFYMAIAFVYCKTDRFQEAIEPLKQAIALEPEGQTYLKLGMVYLKLGDKALAMEQYQILKEINSLLADDLLKQINKN